MSELLRQISRIFAWAPGHLPGEKLLVTVAIILIAAAILIAGAIGPYGGELRPFIVAVLVAAATLFLTSGARRLPRAQRTPGVVKTAPALTIRRDRTESSLRRQILTKAAATTSDSPSATEDSAPPVIPTSRQAGAVPTAAPSPAAIERHHLVEIEYCFYILGSAAPPADMPAAAEGEWRALHARGLGQIPTPEELAIFFAKHAMLTPQRHELIADFRHYRQHRSHRRPALWNERANWYCPR